MSFLQPWLLVGLPLIALPIIIHLINQLRFQTVHWGAMMFLFNARRMSRGYSRIRQWLILLFRTLAVAGLVLAISRPLASKSNPSTRPPVFTNTSWPEPSGFMRTMLPLAIAA